MCHVGALHHLEDARDVVERDALVEEVAHRVDEDHPRLAPRERQLQPLGPEAQVEALLVGVTGHAAEPLRERLGVAVRAAGRHLVAARDRVPRRVRPLDRARRSHDHRFNTTRAIPAVHLRADHPHGVARSVRLVPEFTGFGVLTSFRVRLSHRSNSSAAASSSALCMTASPGLSRRSLSRVLGVPCPRSFASSLPPARLEVRRSSTPE